MNALAQFVSPQPEARMIQNALVVDSNELQHLPMAKVLRQSGVSEVISALDGARAVAALRDRSWDLIVLDLDITDLTGLQVIDLLAERCRNVRLVIVSSQPSRILNAASAYARHRGLAVAAALRKPLKAEQVRNIVAAAVESPTSAHDAAPVKRSAQQFSREELRGALLEQQIQAYFQPQHCAITGVLRGAEILARWHRADGSVLAPAEFLPAMEREGLLESLTSYMLSCAFDCIAAEDSESSLLMAVNVPACIATGVHWAQSVADHAYHAGVDPSRVVIEITEDGGEPRFKAWMYEKGQPKAPEGSLIAITLTRPNGEKTELSLTPSGNALNSEQLVAEPHIFEATAAVQTPGESYLFAFSKDDGKASMTDAQVQAAGVTVDAASPANIRSGLQFPGEIRFNEDRTAHMVPRVTGVVDSVSANLGEQVKKGQVLAVISSTAISETRAELQAAQQRRQLAKTTYDRERKLFEERISPEQDMLLKLNGLKAQRLDLLRNFKTGAPPVVAIWR